MNVRLAVLMSLASVSLPPCAARADVITQSRSVALAGPGQGAVLSFQQFDPLQGTLDQVLFRYNFAQYSQGFVDNSSSPIPAEALFEVFATAAYTAPSFTDFGSGANSRPVVVDAGGTGATPLSPSHFGTGSPGDSAPYIGAGEVGFSVVFQDFNRNVLVISGAPASFGVSSGPMDVNVTVEYHFTPAPVPEPSSLALLGLAGVGGAVGAWRRRRAFQAVA